MTSSSDRPPRPGSLYARFIPREELHGFTAWMPGSFEPPAPVEPPEPTPCPDISVAEHEVLLEAARAAALEEGVAQGRRQGYEDGLREGLSALEDFKRQHAGQLEAQVGMLLQSIDTQFQALEDTMAQAVAEAATRLARAVLRTELHNRPEAVAAVAQEAVAAMLAGSRQLRMLVHPEDEPLVRAGAGVLLESRGARVLASPAIARGGCVVESELGRVDARIEQRWAQAAQLLGVPVPWSDPAAEAAARPVAAPVAPAPAAEADLDLDLGEGPALPGGGA
ncbi:FliH/SctL family protein [uncultured Azohydromonas sp.]|uniref:FliH/SctL family protein n=1 Tax=uncultured Azohydromonas sp. TaxID=487342 RepID=UPI00260EEDB3|nr:FliH/SctL family protein [uncultured Azohydromonas sp.]